MIGIGGCRTKSREFLEGGRSPLAKRLLLSYDAGPTRLVLSMDRVRWLCVQSGAPKRGCGM